MEQRLLGLDIESLQCRGLKALSRRQDHCVQLLNSSKTVSGKYSQFFSIILNLEYSEENREAFRTSNEIKSEKVVIFSQF